MPNPLKKETVKIRLRQIQPESQAQPPATRTQSGYLPQEVRTHDPTSRWKNELLSMILPLVLSLVWSSIICQMIMATTATAPLVFAMAYTVAFIPLISIMLIMACQVTSIIDFNRGLATA